MRQLTIVLMFTATFLGSPILHAAERQLATLQGLSAVVQDGFCRSNVAVRVLAPNASEFSGDKINLQRLIGALRIPLSMECPTSKEFLISGRVGKQEVYLGSIAEANDWILKDKPELLEAYQAVGQFTDKYLKETKKEINDLERKNEDLDHTNDEDKLSIGTYAKIKQIEDSYVRDSNFGQQYKANCQRYYTEAQLGGEKARCIDRGLSLLNEKINKNKETEQSLYLKKGEIYANARNYNEAFP